jgi:ribokinase
VGNDERGEAAIRNLKKEGVETCYITRANTFTGVALILVDQSAEKSIGACMGANAKLTAAHVRAAADVIRSCKVLLMQLEVPDAPLLAAAKLKKDHRIFLDPAPPRKVPPELLNRIEVIRPNSSEAEFLTGIKVTGRNSAWRAAEALIKRGVPTVIVQAGEGGDLLVTKEGETYSPHFKVKSVDATGAGDAFAAAFAAGMAEAKTSSAEILKMASATAALKTTKMGAQAGLPTRRGVEEFLRKHR